MGGYFNDDIESDTKKAEEYSYLRVLRFHLILINSWPSKEIGEKVPKIRSLVTPAILILKLYYMVGLITHMTKNKHVLGFYDMGHTYIMTLMTFVCLSRILLMTLNKKCTDVAVTFLTKMHLCYVKGLSEFAMKTHKRIHYVSSLYTVVLLLQFWPGVIAFNLIPIYKNYIQGNFNSINLVNTTYENSIYISYPFDTTTNLYGYLISNFFNIFDSYICSGYFIIYDLLVSLIIFHLWGNYKILLNELDSFPLPAKKEVVIVNNKNEEANAEMYSENELKIISEKLKKCIDYHRIIAAYTNKISDALGPMLFIYYGYHQTCGCILLLESSQLTAEALLKYGPLTILSFQQLIQLSVIFELIGTTSEKIKDAVYGVPWQHMDIQNRKTVMIFLINVQEPVHVKALGLAQVGVTTMAAILKTTLTYFMFLRSL